MLQLWLKPSLKLDLNASSMVWQKVNGQWVNQPSGQDGYTSAPASSPNPGNHDSASPVTAVLNSPGPSPSALDIPHAAACQSDEAEAAVPEADTSGRRSSAPVEAALSAEQTGKTQHEVATPHTGLASGGLPVCIQFCSDTHLELPLETRRFGQHLHECLMLNTELVAEDCDFIASGNVLPCVRKGAYLALLGDVFDGAKIRDGAYKQYLLQQCVGFEVSWA